MSIRSFVFCDICNPEGRRHVEERRGPRDEAQSTGRRIGDGRAWFEGSLEEACQSGWVITAQGKHVCARCHDRGLARD